MCGIVGFSGNPSEGFLQHALALLEHRGPDSGGVLQDAPQQVSLGMRRLEIQDRLGGSQPMTSPRSGATLIFNGEIFNAHELREMLEARGHSFLSSHSDTEVLLQAYERHGTNVVKWLNGMFSFVIHDPRRRLLFGARDPFGIKPLHYSLSGRRLSFCSEIDPLLEAPWISKDLDFQAIYDFFSFGCFPSPATPYKDVKKLPPGHFFEYSLESGEFRLTPYFSLNPGTEPGISRDEAQDLIREKLESAVAGWLQSDVPLAFLLSGGLDSATMVGLAAQTSRRKLGTFTFGIDPPMDGDERHLASIVAKKWDTEHSEVVVSEKTIATELPAMVESLGEPYFGGLPSWFVFGALSRDYKVAITGTGGDELFGNYGKWLPYESPRYAFNRIKQSLREGAGLTAAASFPHSFFAAMNMREREKSGLFSREFRSSVTSTESAFERYWRGHEHKSARDIVPMIDFQTQLPEEFLMMTDRFSMAHSVEARTPFLDGPLVRTVIGLNSRIRTSKRALKGLLLDSVSDLLPSELASAPKQGFVLPEERLLRGHLMDHLGDITRHAVLADHEIFDSSALSKLILHFKSGNKTATKKVWSVFMFQMWLHRTNRAS